MTPVTMSMMGKSTDRTSFLAVQRYVPASSAWRAGISSVAYGRGYSQLHKVRLSQLGRELTKFTYNMSKVFYT